MATTFRYKTVRGPDGKQLKSPVVPVTLSGADERIETIALLDSGADVSALPLALAQVLGLDLSHAKNTSFGIGGGVDSIETKMWLSIKMGHHTRRMKIPVMVICDDYQFPVLIGRAGFFEKFTITFDEDREKVTLKYIKHRR